MAQFLTAALEYRAATTNVSAPRAVYVATNDGHSHHENID